MALGQHLRAGHDQPQLGGRAQLGRQPCPLCRSEHRLGRIGIGQVALLARRAALVGDLERRAEPACVEQDDLYALAGRAEGRRGVEAVAAAPCIAGGHLPEFQELFLGNGLVRKLRAAVVQAIVVVVPDREVGNGAAQPAVAFDTGGGLVGALEVGGVGGLEVAIDIVAGEDEKVGSPGQDGFPDGLRLGLIGARSEGDARQRHRCLRGHAGGREGGQGEKPGKRAAAQHGQHRNDTL